MIKKKPKTKKRLKQICWDAFSLMIRVFYANPDGYCNCYTCGKRMYFRGEGAQAGHFNAGRHNADLFDINQVRVQCYACNVGRYGEQHEFGERLRAEVGEDKFQEIKNNKQKTVKYSPKDYERMTADFKQQTEIFLSYKNFTLGTTTNKS